jgi:hypothetical protein
VCLAFEIIDAPLKDANIALQIRAADRNTHCVTGHPKDTLLQLLVELLYPFMY